jgi:uroporphyrin-III C-methyltransferase/precorrin-2 dehydrogenase/sirohydrochlorin ferrochelatase
MNHWPIFLNLLGRPVLVAGGGAMAYQRIGRLRAAGAHVTVAAAALSPQVAALVERGAVHHVDGLEHLTGGRFVLAFGAAEDAQANERLYAWACAREIPVHVADRPEWCTFILPAVVERPPVLVAVSTGGCSPTLARLLRERLEAAVPAAYGTLARLAGAMRGEVKRRLPDFAARRRFWQRALCGPAADYAAAGQEHPAREELAAALAEAEQGRCAPGAVWLVGAGPGDPELLTLKALNALQRAEVVIYDRLVSREILALAPPAAERIYAGKTPGGHRMEQAWTEALMIGRARRGQRVVRLKGGDPFLFGRGGEELERLRAEGITVHVVPGITAATGCAAAAAIPLTHRDHAHQVLLVTAHRCGTQDDLDWAAMTRPRQTLVVYMGLQRLERLLHGLMAQGMAPETPAALVAHGTTPRQRVVRGSIATLAAQARGCDSPALLIVGAVAALGGGRRLERLAAAAWREATLGETARHGAVSP